MKEVVFKMPLYWGKLWKDLPSKDIGKIAKCVFQYALDGEYDPPYEMGNDAAEILVRCIEDIKYQKQHPRCYKKPENAKEIRNCEAYRLWRAAVFDRDHYTCQICGKVGGVLNAHHIKHFAKHPELRFDENNGITLCKECHKLAHRKRG